MKNSRAKFSTSMEGYEKVNDRFSKVKIRIAYSGENRNGSYISREAFEKSAYSLKYSPIVGYYIEEDSQFDGHTQKMTIQGDEIKVETLTRPYGVVSGEESDKPHWESVTEEDGTVREYFTCYGYLWSGRYSELESINNGNYSQSMEIIVNDGYWDETDNLYHIEDFTYDGLCILEREIPCFESSTISLNFSKKEYEDEYKTMISELKKFTLNTLEGGDVMEDNAIVEEAVEVEIAEPVVEEVETPEVEVTEEVEEVEVESTETVEEVEQPVEATVETEEVVEATEETQVEEDFEAKYNETLTELNELKAKYVDLESNYSALNGEVSELREYKLNIEKQAKDEKLNAIFTEYEALKAFDEYNSLFEKRYELDEEELVKSLKVIAYDNGINVKKQKKEFSKEKNTIKVPVVSGADFSTNSAWSLLDRHIKK